jgi:hypothetical protein
MFDVLRENPKKTLVILLIPALIAILYLLLVLRYTAAQNDGYVGALLDDTWIHVRYAESISEGNGLAYNEGEISSGATSPLWVLSLAAIYAISNPSIDTQVHIAIGLSAVGNVLTVLAITGFGWWASRKEWIGLLAGLLTALTGRFIWMGLSGMETTAFTALCILAIWSHVADVRQERVFGWRTGILAALATLGRPEGYLLAVVIGVDAFIFVPLRDRLPWDDLWQRVRYGWRGCIAYLLLAGSYLLASWMMTGHILPNTFRAKSELGQNSPNLPHDFFWTPSVDHGWLLIILAGIGIGFLLWQDWTRKDRTGFSWALWPILFVLGVLFIGPDHYVINHGRYVAPAIPFHALATAIGLWAIIEQFTPTVGARHAVPLQKQISLLWIPSLSGLVLVSIVFWLGRESGATVANDVHQLKTMHVAAGEFLRDHTQPDETIALNDVGAIVHISDRRVLDLVGLVSTEVTDAISDTERFTCPHDLQLARVMRDDPPALIAIFPWFFPCLSNWQGALQPFTVFEITGPTVIAGGEMVVYWPVWENWPVQRAIPPEVTRLDASFEQGITLAGYQTQIVDNKLQITLWWQAEGQPEGDYTVFAHLIDNNGEIIAQSDSRPQLGQFNTLWWHNGDLIADPRIIPIDDTAIWKQEGLALRVGLYPTEGTGRLLRVSAPIDQPDFVILSLATN